MGFTQRRSAKLPGGERGGGGGRGRHVGGGAPAAAGGEAREYKTDYWCVLHIYTYI